MIAVISKDKAASEGGNPRDPSGPLGEMAMHLVVGSSSLSSVDYIYSCGSGKLLDLSEPVSSSGRWA